LADGASGMYRLPLQNLKNLRRFKEWVALNETAMKEHSAREAIVLSLNVKSIETSG
jgi:hypothetical protein